VLIWIRARRSFGYTLDELAGLGRSMAWPALLMTLFMLSLTGIPPTAGFWGKFYFFTAVVRADLTWLAIVAVIMSSVSAFYYLRVVWYLFFRDAPEGEEAAPEPAASQLGVGAAVAVCAAGVLLIGLFPGPVLRAAEAALRFVVG
jgi:NADH-quinone oxidoreductase subunit N